MSHEPNLPDWCPETVTERDGKEWRVVAVRPPKEGDRMVLGPADSCTVMDGDDGFYLTAPHLIVEPIEPERETVRCPLPGGKVLVIEGEQRDIRSGEDYLSIAHYGHPFGNSWKVDRGPHEGPGTLAHLYSGSGYDAYRIPAETADIRIEEGGNDG